MSRPQVHIHLQELFEERTLEKKQALYQLGDFSTFLSTHHLKLTHQRFLRSLTHSSFSHEFGDEDQEQLEFLGDAVVDLIVSEDLLKSFPTEKEGILSKKRSALVNEKSLALIAKDLGLQDLILVGKGEFKKNAFISDAILADTLEALIGALYLENKFEELKEKIKPWFQSMKDDLTQDHLESFDAKSKLQELSLARFKKLPVYLSSSVGDEFQVQVLVNDVLQAEGIFSSKKKGEKILAEKIINQGLKD